MPLYRNTRTGRIGEYSAATASHSPYQVEVGSDAKPLAFTPIPEASVAAVKTKKEDAR